MKAKVITATMALTVAFTTPVYADVYVAVDKDGNVVSSAIMCDPITCGAGSDYSNATLQDGQHYVLQSNGNAGIGNNTPNTAVKVDEVTNIWTVTTPTHVQQYNNTIDNPIIVTPPVTVIDTATAITDTATATIDSATALLNTATVTKDNVLTIINALLAKIFALLAKLGAM